jgi:hypothetical protein
VPGIAFYGLVGVAGLCLGVLWFTTAAAGQARRRGERVRRYWAIALIVVSGLLTLLAPRPPADEAPLACVRAHHCVRNPSPAHR